jgi:hypothetical protein
MIEDHLVYYYFHPRPLQGLWSTIREPHAAARVKVGRNPQLSTVILNSQSRKTTMVRGPAGP